MIRSKSDYINYRKQDGTFNRQLKEVFFDDISHFKIILRKTEYYENSGKGFIGKVVSYFYKARLKYCSRRLGFSIPRNVFGPGLSIPHCGTIIVSSAARVGSNCRLHVCVVIAASSGSSQVPKIGNNVYIGPGAKIFGDIEIADGIAIGANSVVNRSFLQPGITIAGVPAKQIGEGGSVGAGWNPI